MRKELIVGDANSAESAVSARSFFWVNESVGYGPSKEASEEEEEAEPSSGIIAEPAAVDEA